MSRLTCVLRRTQASSTAREMLGLAFRPNVVAIEGSAACIGSGTISKVVLQPSMLHFRGFSAAPESAKSAVKEHSMALYGAAGVLVAGGLYVAMHSSGSVNTPTSPATGQAVRPGDSFSRAASAGSGALQIAKFEDLVDQFDNKWTHDDILGDYAVVVFAHDVKDSKAGFLEKLKEIVRQSDRKSNMHHLQPVVVILGDPDVEAFKKVSTQSHERLLALRGPETQQIFDSAGAFVTASQTGDNSGEEAISQGGLSLVDPEGTFIAIYPQDTDAAEVASRVADEMVAYKRKNPAWHGPKSVRPFYEKS